MLNLKKRLFGILIVSLSFILIVGCGENTGSTTNDDKESENGSEVVTDLRFMAADQSGAWYPLAVGVTEMLQESYDALENVSIEPGGGISNVIAVHEGQGQMGFSQASPVFDGYYGNPPFDEATDNAEYVLSLFPHQTHIVVLEGSGIESIEDVEGTRINVGPAGLLTEDIAQRILGLYDLSYDDMGSVQNLTFADSVEQMRDGHLDVLFWTVPAPFAVLTDLAQSRDIELLELPAEDIEALSGENTGLIETTLEAGTYNGVDHDVQTIQSPIVIVANKDAPEEFVYETTKNVVEGLEELAQINPVISDLEPEDLAVDIDVPRHPGAEKYFTEEGFIE